jgi:UDP-glucose 4-epimerase
MTDRTDHRVLITGGAGLVGSSIADRLLEEGVGHIVVLDSFGRGSADNLMSAAGSGRVSIVDGDVRDRATVARVMDGVDVVFHQAALRLTKCAEDPRAALEVMVDGTFNLLEAAVAARVGKVVFASSASVYGMAEQFPTPEDHHVYDNRTFYGAAKSFGEGMLRSFHEMYGLDYVALRYFNVYGPRMDIRSRHTEVMVKWMERIAAGKPPLILGDGTTMDFVYIDDVARANVLAAWSPVTDEVCNVASGVETSLGELATALLDVMGSDLQPEYGPARSVNAVPRRLGDTRKAERLLGFRAEVGLEEGLRRLVKWWWAQQALGKAS